MNANLTDGYGKPWHGVRDIPQRGLDIADRVRRFVRDVVIPYEQDSRWGDHGPTEDLVTELRSAARTADVLTPYVVGSGEHLTHRETAVVLAAAGLSPLGPVAINGAAPDEGNIFMLSKIATQSQKEKYLTGLVKGEQRSSFFMTEPAMEGGAGSDPSMLKTLAVRDEEGWVINGRKTFVTGIHGAKTGIIMALAEEGACMFLVDLPNPAIRLVRLLDTIDSATPGGHGEVEISNLRLSGGQLLGKAGDGFRSAQVRLAPARLTHCMRWLGAAQRAQEEAETYARAREAFGKPLIDHEGVGFSLVENRIALKQAELMIDWCAGLLDTGALCGEESSMSKVAVSEALYTVVDKCVQVMGGSGVSRDYIVERVFREMRAFRIYDGPTEVHKWSLAKKIKHGSR